MKLVRLKIEAEKASGDEAETSIIVIIIEYLYFEKQVQIVLKLAFNVGD